MGEVHATATIQMGPGWGGAKNRGVGVKDPVGLPPLGKRKKSESLTNGNASGEVRRLWPSLGRGKGKRGDRLASKGNGKV